MSSNKCVALKRDGTRCENNPMKNSKYCWSHSIGRFKGTPWYKNGTIQFFTVLLIPLVIFAIQWYQQEQVKSSIQQISKEVQDLHDYDEKNYGELIRKYPLGWIYFVIDQKEKKIVSKDRTHLSTDYEIDWNSAKIIEISSHRIIFELPNILHKPTGNYFFNNKSIAGRVIGRPYKVGIGIAGIRMWFELLADDSEKLIWLIGFREEKPTDQ